MRHFYCVDAKHNSNRDSRTGSSRIVRSQIKQDQNIVPVTKESSQVWPRPENSKRGLVPMQLANNAYQNAFKQPLYYTKQYNWPMKRYNSLWRKNPIGSVPARPYYPPPLPQGYNMMQNPGSRNALPQAADVWNNVDEDTKFVEGRIQEYYDQRINKDRNQWMFKPIGGTTQHLKDIFVGRCWDFLANKGKGLENPSKLDCEELWETFLKSFAFKGPCDVTSEDYTPFFKMYDEKPLDDRVRISK